jgi:hypothetical protein
MIVDAERQKLQFLAATVKNSPNYELSNGGFYMAPTSEPVKFGVCSNGYVCKPKCFDRSFSDSGEGLEVSAG